MSKVLVITGMHRSGTSLITQWLSKCGLFVGAKLAGPDIGNSEGFFEDLDFRDIHKKFLKTRKCSTAGFEHQTVLPLSDVEKGELENVIDKRDEQRDEWGWKDPITCLFLDQYRELIPSAYYLVIFRDFRSTISSLVNREHKYDMKKFAEKKGLSRLKWNLLRRTRLHDPFTYYSDYFLKIWIHYYENIFDHLRRLPDDKYVCVKYAQLIKDDRKLFEYLNYTWKFSLNYFPFSDVYKHELISQVHSVDKYIQNKRLLLKARDIEAECNRVLSDIAGGHRIPA